MAAVDELREELAALKDEQATLNTEWEGKRFDEPTRSRFNELESEIREKSETVAELDKRLALIDRHKDDAESVERPSFQTRRPGAVTGNDIYDLSTINRSWDNPQAEAAQYHDRAMRSVEQARFPHPVAESRDARSHLEQMLGDGEGGDRKGQAVAAHLLATGSPEYRHAFTRYLSGAPLNERDQGLLYRAMSLTTTSGGFAVPFVLDPTLLPTSNGAINPYRAIANVSAISVDEWRGVTSGGITAAFQAEAAATTDNSPTLAQPTVSTEMGRAAVPFSIEIGMDWGSFASEMAGDIQDAKDTLEATKFAVGSGTNEPFGVITGATTVFTASNTSSLVIADIYGVHNALGPRFRHRATWTLNNAVLDKIRQIDTVGGSQLLVPNIQLRSAAEAATMVDGRAGVDLFGHAVYEATGQSGTFTTGQLIGVVGDYSRYYKIVDRIGLTIEVVQHLQDATTGFPTGQRALFAYWRVGAKVLNAAAFRTLKLA
jgi:HK97 family phage major capsid protein